MCQAQNHYLSMNTRPLNAMYFDFFYSRILQCACMYLEYRQILLDGKFFDLVELLKIVTLKCSLHRSSTVYVRIFQGFTGIYEAFYIILTRVCFTHIPNVHVVSSLVPFQCF